MKMSNKNLLYQIEQWIVFKYSNPVPSWHVPIIWHLLIFWIMKRIYSKKVDHTHFSHKNFARQNARKKRKKKKAIYSKLAMTTLPAHKYLFKVTNKNIRLLCWIVIWTNLLKVHNQSSVFAVNFEHIQAIIQHIDLVFFIAFPADIYLFKVNITNNRKRCKIHSELTIKATEQHHWSRSGFFIVNFEHISYLFVASIVSSENLFGELNFLRKHGHVSARGHFIHFFPHEANLFVEFESKKSSNF